MNKAIAVPPQDLLQITLGVMDASQGLLEAQDLTSLREMILKYEDIAPTLLKTQPIQYLGLYQTIFAKVHYNNRLFDSLRHTLPMKPSWFYAIDMGEPKVLETQKTQKRGSAHYIESQ